MIRLFVATLLIFALPVTTAAQSLSLAEVMDAIEADHLQLEVAAVQLEQADELRAQAIGRTRPQISMGGTYTFRDEAVEFGGGNPYAPIAPYLETIAAEHPDAGVPDPALLTAEAEPQVIQYRHDVAGSLTVQQTLFNMRSRPYLRQTEVLIEEARNGRERTELELQGVALRAYFQALLQQRLIEVAERNEELAQLSYDAAAGLNQEGAGNRFAVNRAEVELSRATRETENAQTAYAVALRQLCAVALLETDFDVVAPPTLVTPANPTVPEGRPDLVAHALAAERAEWTIRETRARWYPALVAVAQANVQRESVFGGDRFAWAVQFIASWDLFDGGQRQAIRRQQEGDLAIADLRQQQTYADLEAAVDTAMLNIDQLERNIVSAQADSALAAENLELTQEAERLGVATALDTQLAREQLFLSELAMVTAEVSLQASIYELYRLIGAEPWR